MKGVSKSLKLPDLCLRTCAALLLLMGTTQAFAEPQRIVRITTGEWPPYTSENMPFYGVASHVITEAFAQVDIVAIYSFFPWARAMKVARDGDWDATSIWFDTKERRENFFYSEPIITGTNSFFYLKDSDFDWHNFNDLAKFRIGGTLEYSYGKEFDDAEAKGVFHTQRSRSDVAGLQNLLKGRIDVFPGELMVTYELIGATFGAEEASRMTHHPKPISVQPLYLLFSKSAANNKFWVELFNKGMERLKESGRYDQIVSESLGNRRAVRE